MTGLHRRSNGRSLQAQDRQRERILAQYPDRRLMRVPWGWNSYTPKLEDDIYAPTLDELEARLAEECAS